MHTSPRGVRAWLLAVVAWALLGTTLGLLAGYLSAHGNDSIVIEGNGLRFAGVVAVSYATLFTLGALTSHMLGAGWRRLTTSRARPVMPESTAASVSGEIVAAAACAAILAIGFHVAGRPPLKTFELPLRVVSALIALLATRPVANRIRAGLAHSWTSWVLPVTLLMLCAAFTTALHTASRSESLATVSPLAAGAASGRVFLIGLDGADWRRIRPLVAQGRLPTFAALMRDGVSAPLTSMKPTWSPILWTTIATGVGEALHGVHGFTEVPIPGLRCGVQNLPNLNLLPRYLGLRPLVGELLNRNLLVQVPISACHRRVKAVWNIASDYGRRVAVVNWWGTWPSEPVNGYLVSDNNPRRAARMERRFGQTNPVTFGVTYPAALMSELAKLDVEQSPDSLSGFIAAPFFADLSAGEREELQTTPRRRDAFSLVYGVDAFSVAAGLRLLDNERVDFLALYLPGIDNVSHLFPFYQGVVDHYYERVDRWLAEYVAQADDHTTVVLVSDHGWDYERGGLSGHEHAPDGILLMSGGGIRAGAQLAPAPSLLDVTPTLLALLGLPRATDMPGRVLTEALQPEVIAAIPHAALASYGPYSPPMRVRGADATELTDETTEKLRALGYVK